MMRLIKLCLSLMHELHMGMVVGWQIFSIRILDDLLSTYIVSSMLIHRRLKFGL